MLKDNEFFLRMEDRNREYPGGAWKAYWAWRNCLQYGSEEYELGDHLWSNEVKDFVETVKAAGITSFLVTGQSTALMRNLFELSANGCEMGALCMIRRPHGFFKDEPGDEVMAIRFNVLS